MKNSIGKPYEGKLHVRFDEGGADSLFIIVTFKTNNLSRLSGSTLRGHARKAVQIMKHRFLLLSIILFLTLSIKAQDISNDSSFENIRIFGLYSGTFQSKSGITVGLIKNKNGFYFNGRYGKFTRTDTKNTVYDYHWINERYSVTIGYIRELNKFIDIFAGLGYGYLGYQYLVDDFDSGDWISYLNDNGNDCKTYQTTDTGLESEIGLIFHYKFLYANIGLSTLNLKNIAPIYGIGFGYKF